MKTALLLLLALAGPATGGPLMVGAASDLAYCIDDLAAAFGMQEKSAEVRHAIGSSGSLFAQIKNGAPVDVFLAADMSYPARLAREGAADGATLTPYAIGRIAIWSLDKRFDLGLGMRVFADPRLTRVAIANPDVAPYGRAARAALQHHRLWDAVKPRLVLGDSIAQTAQFIQTGNAQLGVVSYATVQSPRMKGVGSHYLIPADGLDPIEQGAIVTTHGKANPLALRFVQFLKTAPAQAILRRSGFSLPAHD